MAALMAANMPARGERSAPSFDAKQPRTLLRYWADLESLFIKHSITDEDAKKTQALRYVDVDTESLWNTLAAASTVVAATANDPARNTWDEFKSQVGALYPGSETNRTWTVSELDKLVGERGRLGVHTLGDLGDFHRQFVLITNYLISKDRFSKGEQSRAFQRAFQPELWRVASQRLQIKFPDHHPDDPYPLAHVYEAISFALAGTSAIVTTSNPVLTSSPGIIAVPPSVHIPTATDVKLESFASVLKLLAESVNKLVESNQRLPVQAGPPRTLNQNCHMCNKLGCMIGTCPVAKDYELKGLAKRNAEGRIVLPSGAFVPRDITGVCLKDRIDEWHRLNPGQVAKGHMMYGILSNAIPEETKVTITTRNSHPEILQTAEQEDLTLSIPARILHLERELYSLRTNVGPAGATRSRRGPRIEEVEEEDIPRNLPTAPRATPRDNVEVVIPIRRKPPAVVPEPEREEEPERENEQNKDKGKQKATEETSQDPPVHPFASAQDATYAPPHDRNMASVPKPPPAKKPEPAYKTTAPVYDEKIASNVFNRVLDLPITISQKELYSLSPEVRSQINKVITPRRVPPKDITKAYTYADEALPYAIDDFEGENDTEAFQSTFAYTTHYPSAPPPGAFIIPDHYEQYLKSLPPGEEPQRLTVAKESAALRSIHPVVDNNIRVESLIDPGSQIIAMSEDVCTELALAYDPSIILNMQSANGAIDQSLGLARNVPFYIGDITVYLQCHILRSPAYDVLLGRPFDILTQSMIKNYANEDQTITIFDPNSGRRSTIPTTARGPPRIRSRRGFQS